MLGALRTNPALLKLDLYCRGVRLDGSCYVEEDGGRKILRTRAGLGSGLELVLPGGPGGPGGYWTNVPVTERFVERSPYTLHRVKGQYLLRWNGADVAQVQLSPRPGWYDRTTTSGKPMTRIGTLQGTYLGIYQAKVCEYWTARPARVNCKFCSGPRHEPWVTNGEIIAGLEPPESSIRAIDWITSVGAIPTVCVFRPLTEPPRSEDLVPVFRRLYEACMERGLPIGCAPNVHVSLVLLPEECRPLSPRRYPLQTLKLKVMAKVFARRLAKRLPARATPPDGPAALPAGSSLPTPAEVAGIRRAV
jgi:hypothetical protein